MKSDARALLARFAAGLADEGRAPPRFQVLLITGATRHHLTAWRLRVVTRNLHLGDKPLTSLFPLQGLTGSEETDVKKPMTLALALFRGGCTR